MDSTFALVASFLLGLCIGSFLNVCIWRIPQGESITLPASHCPKCNSRIRPLDNIPVLSWVLLGGKCRDCRAPISPRYPLIELLTGLAFLACVWHFGVTREAAKWAIFLSLLIVLFFTDIYFRTLPDEVNLFGAATGMALSWQVPVNDGTFAWLLEKSVGLAAAPWMASAGDAALGASVALGLWAFADFYSRLKKKPQMGFGDVKMMAMMGTFLGIKKTFLTLLFGSVLGSILGLAVIVILFYRQWRLPVAHRAARLGLGDLSSMRWTLARRYQLPFGTFLAVGAAAAVFWGGPLLLWYGAFFR